METPKTLPVGYRQLTPPEMDLVNKIKAYGMELEKLILEVETHCGEQFNAAVSAKQPEEIERLRYASPQRWVAIARTEMQQGLMALTRAVAQPTIF